MQSSFWTAASGLACNQSALDVVSNNVANVNTVGFKTSSVSFQTIFSSTLGLGGAQEAADTRTANPVQTGYGVVQAAVTKSFEQGSFTPSNDASDVAIWGDGFFVLNSGGNARSDYYYTRCGDFSLSPVSATQESGPVHLVSSDGYIVQGNNATLDPTTGLYVLESSPTLEDITLDLNGTLPPAATTAASLGFNIDNTTALAVEPTTMTLTIDGVDRSFRVEFQRAADENGYYFFRATDTAKNESGVYVTLTDSNTNRPITGVIKVDSAGVVQAVYDMPAVHAAGWLSAPEVAALTPWTRAPLTEAITSDASGQDYQTYTLGTKPESAPAPVVTVDGVTWTRVTSFTGGPNEYKLDFATGTLTFGANTSAPPAKADIVAVYTPMNNAFTVGSAPIVGIVNEPATHLVGSGPVVVPMALTRPAAFTLANTGVSALTLTLNGHTLVSGTDYALDAATGQVTPLTAWESGPVSASYTSGGRQIVGEQHAISNAGHEFEFHVANAPIDPGTLAISATRNGAALVEGTDYSVDYETGTIKPLTYWDAPAVGSTAVTVSYSQADTRVVIEFGKTGSAISFKENRVTGSVATPTVNDVGDYTVGTSFIAYDSLGNEHTLSFRFERLGQNRWHWEAVPTINATRGESAVIDNPSGGGTVYDGMDVIADSAVTLSLKSNGLYDITLTIDEGMGARVWEQIAPNAAWPSTSGTSCYYKVTNAATGEIAFSRDLAMGANLEIATKFPSATSVGSGILSFDGKGNMVTNPESSPVLVPIAFTPVAGAARLSIAADFSDLKQTARQSDVCVMASDGHAEARIEYWDIDEAGRIEATYTNGMTQYLAQLTLARFANPQGLLAVGQTSFIASASSGKATEFLAGGANPIATIRSHNLEDSNVDMSVEFTNMIVYQRAYQFNSRIITTSDEMIKEAIAMKK